MSSDSELTNANQIHTDGGAAVEGTVNTAGGDFVGRDQAIHGDKVGRDKITGAGDIHIHHYPSNQPAAATSDDLAPAPGDPPYQGMAYYDVADADRFFGREALTADLIDHLRQQPLLAVVGASGSGKSSLVRAGVLPALQGKKQLIDGKQPPTGSARWAYHLITPTAKPLESLAASLTRSSESVTATSTLIDDLRRDQRSLHLYARRSVSGGQRLVLLVDQFEELFTLCKDRAERQAFVENLLYAVQPDGVVTLIVTLRADFYHHCADFPALRTALETQQRYIGAMTPDELRRAIVEPAHAATWSFQPGLVEQLLHDVGDEPGALPLLSHALLETWQRRRGRTLTLAGYRAAGGVQGAIAKTADDVFNRFTEEQKTIARIIFLRLTELGEGVQDTRRRVRPAELKLTQANPDAVQQVLKTLADARLVTTAEDEVQVAHEALIRHWATLRAWLDDDREGHRIQRRLTEAANQWVEFGKEPALLYRGILLQQAQEWLQNTIDLPNEHEMEFLQVSQEAAEMEAKRAADLAMERQASHQRELENQIQRARFFRNAVAITGVLTLFALIATGVAIYLNAWLQNSLIEANQNAQTALSRQLAAQSATELSNNRYERAILLAIESGRVLDTIESFTSIRSAIAYPAWHTSLILYPHKENIEKAIWSADGKHILTTGCDEEIDSNCVRSSVRIWDTANGKKELIKLEGHKGNIWQATWNKNEDRILTVGCDEYDLSNSQCKSSSARIWDARSGKELFKLGGYIGQAKWNQNENKVLIVGCDQRKDFGCVQASVQVWSVLSGKGSIISKKLVTLKSPTNYVYQVEWNHDESRILTAGCSDVEGNNCSSQPSRRSFGDMAANLLSVQIWDAVTGDELLNLKDNTWATWNKDETKILTIGCGGEIRNDSCYSSLMKILDETGKELVRFQGHSDRISQAIWNQDESRILTSSEDSTARIWNASTGEQLFLFEGRTWFPTTAIWSKDEKRVLVASDHATVRIWDATNGKKLLDLNVDINSADQVTWDQEENQLVTIANIGVVNIWDAVTGAQLLEAKADMNSDGSTYSFKEALLNKDKSKLLLRDYYAIRILDRTIGKESMQIEGIISAKWGKDENKLLTYNEDHSVSIWNTITNQKLLTLKGDIQIVEPPFEQPVWNSDESRVLARSSDDTVHIWDSVTGKELAKIRHTKSIDRVQWNRDRSRIMTIGCDAGDSFNCTQASVRTWDTATGRQVAELIAHPMGIDQAEWNHDDSRILTTGCDNGDRFHCTQISVRIWDANNGKELFKFEGYDNAIWSEDERRIMTYAYNSTSRNFQRRSDKDMVTIWDADNGTELIKLKGHIDNIEEVVWSKNGENIIIVEDAFTNQGSTSVWDAATGNELFKLNGHFQAWNKNGNRILIIGRDAIVRIYDAITGEELLKLDGKAWNDNIIGARSIWSDDESRILTHSGEGIVRISDAVTGKELIKLLGISSVKWSQDERRLLTIGKDSVVRIWDSTTGKELAKFEAHTQGIQAVWSQDERRVLIVSDNTAHIRYIHMTDLLIAACARAPRNFTWDEWSIFMNGDYQPTCPNAPIPPDVIQAIQVVAHDAILAGQISYAKGRLEQLNDWLQTNGQFEDYGVDIDTFVTKASATATAEALFTLTPTSSLSQPPSPLGGQPTSPLPSPTVTPLATGTPVASAPVAMPVQSVTSTRSLP